MTDNNTVLIKTDATHEAFNGTLVALVEASALVMHPVVMIALLARFTGKLATLAGAIEYDDLEQTAVMNFRQGFHDASADKRKAAN